MHRPALAAMMLPSVLFACNLRENQETFTVDASVDHLAMDLGVADVMVHGGEGDQAIIVVKSRFDAGRPTVDLVESAGTATLETACPSVDPACRFDVEITLPAGMDLTGIVQEGDVLGLNLAGGTIDLLVSAGPIDLRFAEPPVEVFVETLAGDIDLAVPEGAYRLDLEGDMVQVDGIQQGSGPQLTAWAVAGEVTLRGDGG